MSAFLPFLDRSDPPGADDVRFPRRPLPGSERRARLEVWAAAWRAREVAEAVFGGVGASALLGARAEGPLRGLLRLDVPFVDLHVHQEREARFRAAVAADPVLSRVRLVYVVGPETA